LKEFTLELPGGIRVVAVSDFNILLSQRKRLGGIHLSKAKLVEERNITGYPQSTTRIIYTKCEDK